MKAIAHELVHYNLIDDNALIYSAESYLDKIGIGEAYATGNMVEELLRNKDDKWWEDLFDRLEFLEKEIEEDDK